MELAPGWRLPDGRTALDVGELPKPVELAAALAIIKDACEGLDHVHRQDLIHRDVKPGNLLLFGGGVVKLADFGIARAHESLSLTMTGLAMGTPEYMSPEQAEGRQELTSAADLYALGVVLYELLTGQSPFRRKTPLATAHAHLHDRPPAPRSLNAAIPEDVQAVVLKCLAKKPQERYRSARELFEALLSVGPG
jgi:serine/threonine-protein kinase